MSGCLAERAVLNLPATESALTQSHNALFTSRPPLFTHVCGCPKHAAPNAAPLTFPPLAHRFPTCVWASPSPFTHVCGLTHVYGQARPWSSGASGARRR